MKYDIKTTVMACVAWAMMGGISPAQDNSALGKEQADKFAALALTCLHQEYPNKIAHTLNSDGDVAPPRLLHPAFYGCFDWHSAVHGHWLLVRLLHVGPEGPYKAAAIDALNKSFTAENMAGELAYFTAREGSSYERPYGVAWLLQLTAELRQWNSPQAQKWLEILKPLEGHIAQRLKIWLPKLAYPIRLGTHNQSAFAFGLILDWAQAANDPEMVNLITERSLAFHKNDIHCPITYEPSGEDFLSPCLMEADLMRRILPTEAFSQWLGTFLPDIPTNDSVGWLIPGIVKDSTDGKLVHLDGVNLSRAWNLENIATALPPGDPRIAALKATALIHKDVGLQAVTGDHYAGGHWLASFATYLMTHRGR